MLELGEHLLDRVEVGAAGRKEQQAGARASDRRAHRFGLVAAEIVHDDDVAAAERRNQLGFDIGLEGGAGDRSVRNPRGVDPVLPQSGDECRSVPMAEGSRPVHPLPLGTPAASERHAGLHPSLVDEDQLARIRLALKAFPLLAALRIGAIPLVGDRCRRIVTTGLKLPKSAGPRRCSP